MSETVSKESASFSGCRIFISYSRADGRAFAEDFEKRIADEGLTSWRDIKNVEGGEDITPQVLRVINEVEHLVLIITRRAVASDWVRLEWMHARAHGVKVSPIIADTTLRKTDLPAWASRADIYDISEPERWTKLVQVLKGPGGTRRVPYMTGHLPANFVPRPVQFARAKELILNSRGGAVGLTTALVGAGGYGKTTLANFLCRDEDVRFEFSDGIVRIEIGKERASVLDLICDVIEKLDPDGDRPHFQDETIASEHLAQVIDKARLLLVIDDVWRESQLQPFMLGGPDCVRLVTTRRPNLLPQNYGAVNIDELAPDEAFELLTWELPVGKLVVAERLRALAHRLEGWAQMLEIGNAWLRQRIRLGEGLDEALARFNERLDFRGLEAFDPRDADARNRAIGLCVAASLDDLDLDERARFEELTILPEDEDAPVEIVAALWAWTGRLGALDAEDLLARLQELSLLQNLDLGGQTIRLHDNMKWLLRDRMGAARFVAAHGAMADTIRARGGGSWADLSSKELYGWRHGLRHLRAAGRGSEADALLTDYVWIRAKLSVGGAQTLLEAWQPPPQNEEAKTVGRAIGVSAPILARRPEQLPLQLWGRLGDTQTPRIATLSQAARADVAFLPAPRWPALTPPGPELLRLVGDRAMVTNVAFSPDGRRVASTSMASCRLWNSVTGAEIASLEGSFSGVTFSPDSTLVALRSWTGSLLLWNPENGTKAALGSIDDQFGWHGTSIAFSPDGTRVATAVGGSIRLFDVVTGAEFAGPPDRLAQTSAVAFSSNGLCMATADGRIVRVSDTTGKDIAVRGSQKEAFSRVVLSHGGSRVAAVTRNHAVRLWDAETGAEIALLRGHEHTVTDVAFSPDRNSVATSSMDGTFRIWNIKEGAQTALIGSTSLCVAFSEDSTRLATGEIDGTVRLWDVATIAEAASRHTRSGLWLGFSPDGNRAASASGDGTVKLWDTVTGIETTVLHGHEQFVTSLVFSPDGNRVATVSTDGTVRRWDAATGTATDVVRISDGQNRSLKLSPDGKRVAAATTWSHTVLLWQTATGATPAILRGHASKVNDIAFSPDGTFIATAGYTVRLWDAATGAEEANLRGCIDPICLAFAPNGLDVGAGCGDGTIHLWNRHAAEETAVLRGHKAAVSRITFASDGLRVVTASSDGMVLIWDVAGEAEAACIMLDAPVTAMTLRESTLGLSDALGNICIYDLTPHVKERK
ncbi:NB-ARC domain-containing protein [Rhizobium leguminosarum]|uniref:NB-ARC domain-containing protein n=1 Tax=Rhizobium TaxID=379 RepID=UPI00140F7C38|nr:NB-ARC domain-containing protein [Rhizobium leguminosarum]MBY5326133.1 TIR domain-containing protein [Rhizobium leguminosarum]QIO68918.1 TIR domain-containing protein [Rhizobium leguminosarum bv. trifolii]